jgi:hypothetical protein
MDHLSSALGSLLYATRAECNEVYSYVEISMSGQTTPPANASMINDIFNVPFFTSDVTLFEESEVRSRYTYQDVKMANSKAVVTVLPQFRDADDRALQRNSMNVKITVELSRESDLAFSYSSMRQAQSFLQALYEPDEKEENVKARWKQ